MGSNKKTTLDGEQLVKEVVNYYNNSYYSNSELAEILNVKKKNITDIVSNKEQLLLKYCGKEDLVKFEYMKKNRKKVSSLRSKNSGSSLIKSIEHRCIVKEDVYYVKREYTLKLLDKVILFFQYKGNSVKIEKETPFSSNDIHLSFKSSELKDILKEDVYEKLEVLLKHDKIFTQNMLREKIELAEIMITDMKKLLLNKNEPWQPTIPIDTIYRLLTEEPYVKIKYRDCREELLKALEDYLYDYNFKKEFSQQLIRK